MDNSKVAYTKLLKDIIQEKLNKTPENKKLNDESINNQEKSVEQAITDNAPETKKEDETVAIQQNENVQEEKKEERKYPEEVIKKSLGLENKLK